MDNVSATRTVRAARAPTCAKTSWGIRPRVRDRWPALSPQSVFVSFPTEEVRPIRGASESMERYRQPLRVRSRQPRLHRFPRTNQRRRFRAHLLRINPRQKVPRPIQRRYQRRCQLHPLRLYHPLSVVQRVLTGRPETFQHSIASAISSAHGGNSSRPTFVQAVPCLMGLSKSAIGNGRCRPVLALRRHPILRHPPQLHPFRLP